MAGPVAWTHEKFLEFMSKNKPDFEVLGQYVNSRTPVLVRCKCGNETEMFLSHIRDQDNCSKCKGIKVISKRYKWIEIDGVIYKSRAEASKLLDISTSTISKRIRNPKFKNYIAIKDSIQKDFEHKILKQDNKVSYIGEYKGCNQDVLIKYECGHKRQDPAGYFLLDQHKGCVICNKDNRRKNKINKFQNRLAKQRPDLKVLQEYIDMHTPILFEYKCGHKNYASPHNIFFKKSGCGICWRKNTEEKVREKTSKSVMIDGVHYRSQAEAAIILGISIRNISNRVKNPNFPNYKKYNK